MNLSKNEAEICDFNKFNTSPVLAEQAFCCLELVAQLAKSGLSFQFKGGNSLLIILDKPKRFSIDVDIATDENVENIESILQQIVNNYGFFKKWEKRQHKTKPWIPLTSYYLFYESKIEKNSDSSIMLDVQLGRSPYRTEMKKIKCEKLYESDLEVEVPLPSSIIGDKLLTLGPYTLGIPVGKGKEAQRLKHVHDISRLLKTKPSIIEIRKSFIACLNNEKEIQKCSFETEQVIEDTMNLCSSVMRTEKSLDEKTMVVLEEIKKGIKPFSSHLFNPDYDWKKLQNDLSGVALCLSGIENTKITDFDFNNALEGMGEGHPLSKEFDTENSLAVFNWEIVHNWRNGLK